MNPGNPAVFWSLGWMVVVGFPVIATMTGFQTLIQNATTDRHRGRVYGAFGTLDGIMMLIGLGVAGLLGQWMSIEPLLIGSALLRIVTALIAARFLPRDGEETPVREVERPISDQVPARVA